MSLSWKETLGAGNESPHPHFPGSFLLFASNSHPQEEAQALSILQLQWPLPLLLPPTLNPTGPGEPPALGNKTVVSAQTRPSMGNPALKLLLVKLARKVTSVGQ